MRLIFAALVLAVAALVVGAVLWPRLVDGETAQAQLRQLVEDIAGPEVDVRGRVGINLFPKPRLTLAQVVIGNPLALGGKIRVEADRVDLDVAPLAFLTGRIEVRNARLIRPRLVGAAGQLRPWLAGAPPLPEPARLAALESVQIVDGRIDGLGIGTGFLHLEAVAGTLRRDTLLDQVAVSLTASAEGEPVSLEGELGDVGSASPASLRFELAFGQPGHAASLSFRGFGSKLDLAPELKGEFELEASEPGVMLRLANPALSQRLPLAGAEQLPLLLEGKIETAGLEQVRFSEVACRIGANSFQAEGELTLAPDPRMELRLAANELLLEPAGVPQLEHLAQLLPELASLPGSVSLRAELVRYNDQPFRQLRANLRVNADRTGELERLSAELPGGGDVSLSGRLRRARGGIDFRGKVTLAAEDTRLLAQTFDLPLQGVPEDLGRRLLLTSDLEASPGNVGLNNFELRAAGARVTGSASLIAGRRPRFALSATSDRLNLDGWQGWLGGLPEAGLRERLMRVDGTVDLRAERVGLGELIGSGFYLRALLEQGAVKLNELSLRDLGQTRLRLTGSGDVPVASFQLAGEAESARPALLLRALGLKAPPGMAILGPLRLSGQARGTSTSTEVEADLGGEGLKGHARAVLGSLFDAAGASLDFTAEAPRLDFLLQGLDLVADAPGLDLPLKASGTLRRSGGSYALSFKGELPPSRLEGELSFATGAEDRAVTGSITAPVLDTALLAHALPLLAAPVPELARQLAAAPGALPALPIDLAGLLGTTVDLRLDATRLLGSPSAEDGGALPAAGLRLRLEDQQLTLAEMSLPAAGGTLEGVVTLDAEEDVAVMGVDARLSHARLERLLPLLEAGGGADGEVDLALRLAGGGGDLRQLIGTLEGEGEVDVRGGDLGGVPLPSAGGPLPAASQRLAGRLAVSRGILTSPPPGLALAYPGGEGRVVVNLDLLAWIAEAVVDAWSTAPEPVRARWRFFGAPGRLALITPPPPEPPPGPWLP